MEPGIETGSCRNRSGEISRARQSDPNARHAVGCAYAVAVTTLNHPDFMRAEVRPEFATTRQSAVPCDKLINGACALSAGEHQVMSDLATGFLTYRRNSDVPTAAASTS